MFRSRIEFIIKKRGVCLKNQCTLYGRQCRGLLLDLVSEGLNAISQMINAQNASQT